MDDEALTLRADAVAWHVIDDDAVLLDLRSSTYLTVNRSGTLLLSLLDEGSTNPALVATLCEQFSLDEATARADVEAFLAALRTRGLLAD